LHQFLIKLSLDKNVTITYRFTILFFYPYDLDGPQSYMMKFKS